MDKTLVKEVPFGKAIARIKVRMWEYEREEIPFVQVGRTEVKEVVKVEIVFGGEVKEVGTGAIGVQYDSYYERFYEQEGLDVDKKYTRVGNAYTEGWEVAEKVRREIRNMKEELAKEFGVETKEKKKERKEYERAKAIIRRVEEVGEERLKTRVELEQWKKVYNNVVNEGGEGYIPYKISKEEYEWAKKKVENGRK